MGVNFKKTEKQLINSNLPWMEKYRPKYLNSVSSQEETVSVLKKIVSTKNLPHLLLYGPPGSGKTSVALAIARELFGPNLVHERVLELNASDERGINVIRTKIKSFASYTVANHGDIPNYKMIILDEADWMTKEAQSALRRIMEQFSDVTRFCLICNYVSRVIPPIVSRCSKFHFKPLDNKSAFEFLNRVCSNESLMFTDQSIMEVVNICQGDLRQGITLLQSANSVFGSIATSENILSISDSVPHSTVETILKTCRSENLCDVKSLVQNLVLSAVSIKRLLEDLCETVALGTLEEHKKSKICSKLSVTEERLNDGADTHLQLLDALCFINSVLIS